MGKLLRRLGIFDYEEDPRWQEEYELEKAEREAQDHRYRQYRIERLYFTLWGLDPKSAERLACAVWEDERYAWRKIDMKNLVKLFWLI